MPEVSLQLIHAQMTKGFADMKTRFDRLEAQVGMLQGMLTRLDSADTGLTAELQGLRQMVTTLDARVARLEAAS